MTLFFFFFLCFFGCLSSPMSALLCVEEDNIPCGLWCLEKSLGFEQWRVMNTTIKKWLRIQVTLGGMFWPLLVRPEIHIGLTRKVNKPDLGFSYEGDENSLSNVFCPSFSITMPKIVSVPTHLPVGSLYGPNMACNGLGQEVQQTSPVQFEPKLRRYWFYLLRSAWRFRGINQLCWLISGNFLKWVAWKWNMIVL